MLVIVSSFLNYIQCPLLKEQTYFKPCTRSNSQINGRENT